MAASRLNTEPRIGRSKTTRAKTDRNRHGAQAEREIRDHLADEEFRHAGGRGEQGLDGAALPFARHDERGEQRADHHQDERDGAGHQEAAAFELGVEPDARLGRDQAGRRRAAARQRALGEPGLPRALDIARDEARGVGIVAVGDDLHRRGVAALKALREIAGAARRSPSRRPGRQIAEKGAPVGARRAHRNTACWTGTRGTARSSGVGRLDHEADAHGGHVEGNAEAVEKEQKQRDHHGHDQAAGIAQDLQRFLDDQRLDAAQAVV